MSKQKYAQSVQSAGMLELTRRVMIQQEDVHRWLNFLELDHEESPRVVADVAGGTGAFVRWFLKTKANLKGIVIDLDTDLLDFGKRKTSFEGLQSRLSFQRGDACEIPLKDNSVDVAFIFGALQVISNGQQVISELTRIAREKVVVFWPIIEYKSPHAKTVQHKERDKIQKLMKALNIYGGGIKRSPIKSDLSMESLPNVMTTAGLKNLKVRGLMITVDLDELSHLDYIAYRNEECALLEEFAYYAVKNNFSYKTELQKLVSLFQSRRDELIRDHSKGIRRFHWDGGPVVVWSGEI